MKKLSSILAAVSLSVLFVAVGIPSVSVAAEKREVSQKVGKPLQEALTLIGKRQFEEAMRKVDEAKAAPEKTPFAFWWSQKR